MAGLNEDSDGRGDEPFASGVFDGIGLPIAIPLGVGADEDGVLVGFIEIGGEIDVPFAGGVGIDFAFPLAHFSKLPFESSGRGFDNGVGVV